MSERVTERELNQLIDTMDWERFADERPLPAPFKKTAYCTGEFDGKAAIISGTIIVTDPQKGGSPAVISAELPVVLKINGVEAGEPAEVTSSDLVQWEIRHPPLFEIAVSDDGMQATFKLNAPASGGWKLEDSSPGVWLEIRAVPVQSVASGTLSINDLLLELEKNRILQDIDIPALYAELEDPTFQPIIVARGKLPSPGKDARLELYFSENIEQEFNEIEGQIDYRSHLRIPSVVRGQVIARKYPPEEGTPGYNVFGEMIPAEAPGDIEMVTRNDTVMIAGNEILALREGRPRVTGDKIKYFDISTAYVINGNVNMKTGNITFSGDIIVNGNVEDNMILESLGNVYVTGNVYSSTITATGSISTGGTVINSKLYSGYFGVMFNRIYNTSKLLLEELLVLQKAVRILMQTVEKRRQAVKYGQAVLLIIERKARKLPRLVRELHRLLLLIKPSFHQNLDQLLHFLSVFANQGKMVEYVNDSALEGFIRELEELYEGVGRMQESRVSIHIGKCQSGYLRSNGDIVIEREGIVHSDLLSSGNIIFSRPSAVCRGSRLEAGESIMAGIVGSERGALSYMKAQKLVSARKIFQGRITVGGCTADIVEPVVNRTFDAKSLRRYMFQAAGSK